MDMPPIRKAKDLKKYESGTFLRNGDPKFATVNEFNRKLMDLREKLAKDPAQAQLAERIGKYSGALMALQMHDTPMASEERLANAITDVAVDLPYFLKTQEKGGEEKTGYQRLLEAGQEHDLFTKAELDEVLNLVGAGMGVDLTQGIPQARQQAPQAPEPPSKPYRQALDSVVHNIDTVKSRPAPRFDDLSVAMDPDSVWDYNVPLISTHHKETILTRTIINELRALPREKQEAFFEKAIGPGADRKKVEERFFGSTMKTGNPIYFMDNKYWGRTSNRQMIDALDEVLPPEKLTEIGEKIKAVVTPDEPGFAGTGSIYPDRDKVEKLRQKEQEVLEKQKEDQQAVLDAQANIALLDVVDEQLSVVDPDYREYMNGYDQGIGNQYSLNRQTDWTTSIIALQGTKTLQSGRFAGALKPGKDPKLMTERNEGFSFAASETPQHGRTFREDEIEDLQSAEPPISQPAVDAVQSYFDDLKKLDYSKNPNVVMTVGQDPFCKGLKPDDLAFIPEQGEKYYAYWPLIDAKAELRKAVESGDMAKIRTASEKYQKVDATLDHMMATVGDPKLGGAKLFDGNVNSTRSDTGQIPAKFIKDYATHNKVNSLFCLNSAARNFNMDPMDFVKDPANSIMKVNKAYTDHRGIDRCSSIGGKLCWSLQVPDESETVGTTSARLVRDWNEYFEFPLARGMSAVSGMIKDPKKRTECS